MIFPFQETAEGIPISPVPLCPPLAGRKPPHLVEAAGIPRFRNQLYLTQNRIVSQAPKQRRIADRGTVHISPQDTGQV